MCQSWQANVLIWHIGIRRLLCWTGFFDEFLFFIGCDTTNIDDFRAYIEMALGEEWEINIIDTTSIVYLPAGLQHCPINVKKVDKPFWFGHIMLSNMISYSHS